jgi:L-fucose isomerase-like protein
MTIIIIPFFSPLAPEILRDGLTRKLIIDGVEILRPEDYAVLQQTEPGRTRGLIYILVGSGGSENLIEGFVKKAKLRSPIFLLSHDLNNSLPAAMETRASLEQQGFPSRIIHGSLDELGEQLTVRVQFATITERIGKCKLGIIGKPSHWLIASGVNNAAVKSRWGLTIEFYPMDTLLDSISPQLSEESETQLRGFLSSASCIDIPEEEVEKAARVAQRVSEIVDSNELDAVTIECFNLLMQTKVSGCYAHSTLNEREHFVAGCEGDIPSTFTMLIAKRVTGKPVFMANVSDIDITSNIATFAHCTIPTSLTANYRIMTHFETGMSLGVRGVIEHQPVTVLKVSGEDLSRYWVSRGDIIENPENETACRTQVRVKLQEPVTYFLEESLANHHILILGDFSEKFKRFFSFVIDGW